MSKNILITGATDGLGLHAAAALVADGHRVLLHGRNAAKLERARAEVASRHGADRVDVVRADLTSLAEVEALAADVKRRVERLDVLVNNAGVYVAPAVRGIDPRMMVNAVAPYVLTKRLLSVLGPAGRVVNLSSAAQTRVAEGAFEGGLRLSDDEAYAQSKLALTMWSHVLGEQCRDSGPMIVAVNPKSMLGTKMVQEAYGVAGSDIRVGVDIVCRAALSDEFANASGRYYDNDAARFAPAHPDVADPARCKRVVEAIEAVWSDGAR